MVSKVTSHLKALLAVWLETDHGFQNKVLQLPVLIGLRTFS